MDEKEREFQWWLTEVFCNRNSPRGRETVNDIMTKAINGIQSVCPKREEFYRELFITYVSFGDNSTAMRALCDLIDAQLLAVFESEQQKTADHS